MYLGKKKCKMLKEIRQKIADENDIAYVTSECKHKGDCLGTCPKCEAELRYLEEQLELKRKAGQAVAVAAICATMVVPLTACSLDSKQLGGAVAVGKPTIEEIKEDKNERDEKEDKEEIEEIEEIELSGDVEYISPDEENEKESEDFELSGDVEYIPP